MRSKTRRRKACWSKVRQSKARGSKARQAKKRRRHERQLRRQQKEKLRRENMPTLPFDIWTLIWQHVAAQPQSEKRLCQYATVSRDWQSFFEKQAFKTLTIRYNNQGSISHIPTSKIPLVELIRFEVASSGLPTPFWIDEWIPSSDITDIPEVRDLFRSLSTWIESHSKLTVELDMWYLAHANGMSLSRVHSSQVGFGTGHKDQDFPSVPAIRHLVVLHLNKAQLKSADLACLLENLPCLEILHLDIWRKAVEFRASYHGLGPILQMHFPRSLKELTIFEDSRVGQRFPWRSRIDPTYSFDSAQSQELAAALAAISLTLDKLAASITIDAHDFFDASCDAAEWPKLQYLSLYSARLSLKADHQAADADHQAADTDHQAADTDHQAADDFICRAAAFALKMPVLRILELWYSGDFEAALFRYEVTNDGATISWRGMERLNMSPATIAAWNQVALKQTGYGVHVTKAATDILWSQRELARGLGNAIMMLEPKIDVACPERVQQMVRECRDYGEDPMVRLARRTRYSPTYNSIFAPS